MDWMSIVSTAIGALLGGGGIFGVLIARENKKKTPYDMVVEMLQEQKRFYADRNAEFEKERMESQEKTVVINATHNCQYKYKNPDIKCPVDEANDERLRKQCSGCVYGGTSVQQHEVKQS